MKSFISLNLSLYAFGAFLLTGCAAHKVTIGKEEYSNLSGAKFETKLAGTPRLEFRSFQSNERICQTNVKTKNKNSPRLAHFKINGSSNSLKAEGKTFCTNSGAVVLASFSKLLVPGTYTVDVDSNDTPVSELKGVVLFKPVQPEKLSGPNQYYQGAAALQEGANSAELSPGQGNMTDWWKLQVPKFAKYSILFTQDSDPKEVSAQIYRFEGGKLVLAHSLSEKKEVRLGLEGNYYFKIVGHPYGKTATYSVLLKKIDSSESSVAGSSTEDLPVSDSFPINSSQSAVVVGVGQNRGLKEGETLKIFNSANGKFLDACTLVSVSEAEAECRMDGQLKAEIPLKAKRSL